MMNTMSIPKHAKKYIYFNKKQTTLLCYRHRLLQNESYKICAYK